MKKLIGLLGLIFLVFFGINTRADEKITVASTNEDISQNLDLRVIAKLFAESKNIEEFEENLNKPDKNYSNLDLNGDGVVDYIRVVESGEGDKRLIILQVVLAKDIYQDVASIFVEKDANDQVSVQIVGDEYIYGTNYIIEPYYFYRPLIYDWFWGPTWVRWHSPFYWDYYPHWWYHHHPMRVCDYYGYCNSFCAHHVCCSYHHGRVLRPATRSAMRNNLVSRSDYARTHANTSFASRNANIASNAYHFDKNKVASVRTLSRNTPPSAVTRNSVSASANASTRSISPATINRTRSTNTPVSTNSTPSVRQPSSKINPTTIASVSNNNTRNITTQNKIAQAVVASASNNNTRSVTTQNKITPVAANTNRTFGSSNIISNRTVAQKSVTSNATTSNVARSTTAKTSMVASPVTSATVTRSSNNSSGQRYTTSSSPNRTSSTSSSSTSSSSRSSSSYSSSSSSRSSGSYSGSSSRSGGSYSGSSRSGGGYSGGGSRSGGGYSGGGGSRTRR